MKRGTTPVLITSSIGGLLSTNIQQHISVSKNLYNFDTEAIDQWNNWPSDFIQKIP
jgi:hypothetical protein